MNITAELVGGDAIFAGLDALDRKARTILIKHLAAEQVRLINERVDKTTGITDTPYPTSLRAELQNGQTLRDKGHMLGSMGVISSGDGFAVIGFRSAREALKAMWAQYGTRAHWISAKPGGVLHWKTQTGYWGRGAGVKAGKKGDAFAKSVWHPGTPPRPFFGVSPRDLKELVRIAQGWMTDQAKWWRGANRHG